MTRYLIAAVAGLMLATGCKTNQNDVADQQKDLHQEQARAQKDFSDINQKEAKRDQEARNDFQKKEADIHQDAAKDRADVQKDVNDKQKDLAETERDYQKDQADRNYDNNDRALGGSGAAYDNNGYGGSGATQAVITGTVKNTFTDNLTVIDANGATLTLDTNKNTQVFLGGQAAKLDGIKEGSQVRASYHLDGKKKVADRVDVTTPGSNFHNYNYKK